MINNAGFGLLEDLKPQIEQLDLNVRALVTLTHAFTPDRVAAKAGGVINIASTAAFQPLAGADIYAATEAFVLLFSEGLSPQKGENSSTAS